jgi:hypothetical protein
MIVDRKGIVADTDQVTWVKSSFSNQSGCLEVAKVHGGRMLRDSKNPDEGVVVLDSHEWMAFKKAVEVGEF